MKRTLVERVAEVLFTRYNNMNIPWRITSELLRDTWRGEARRIIAMVRRHDDRKAGKK